MVELASKICETPVSLISLVDEKRQWFKARVGFEPHETALDQSVCSHAILDEGYTEIADMGADPRTSDNPLYVGDPRVKFYAGANLVAPNGQPIGTLCVLDTKPRTLNDFQRQALQTLSRHVMMQLELRKKIRIEAALRAEMDHRVKNSFQTIASLLRMATRKVQDPDAKDVLALVERRFGAVASLHSELMGQGGRSKVQTTSYLEQLNKLLAASAPDHVTIFCAAEPGELQAVQASALGMIVSEFVANSIKHAFAGDRAGEIKISLRRQEGAEGWLLECRDNGCGHAGAVSGADSTGLGRMLMATAAEQLNGRLTTDFSPEGALLRVCFRD
ncbi:MULTISPECIES: histidine kinase dimerization/phosphoacceptor domain -containing protein [unclassified Sulfitobacter]|uniref:histidine kinase dimerization/phosphoacceptor domain -containing protein n=1 Tax=unclassified Sulfitobacter TaxID=196795 RepID=UPI0023E3038C|nr:MULTISPECIES: histidine kinase dimerization/phosphoacceptor domain -containing protein [unclassified Sulfitobacter]